MNNNHILCPICNKIFIKICMCNNRDKKCENNHTWYTDDNGNIQIGTPHK